MRVQRTGGAEHPWLLLQDVIGSSQLVHVMQTCTEGFADWVDWVDWVHWCCCGFFSQLIQPELGFLQF